MEIISTNNNTLLLDDGSGNVSYSDSRKTVKDFSRDSRQKLLISSSNKGRSGGFNNINVVKTCPIAAARRTSPTCPTTQQRREYCAIDADNDYINNWNTKRNLNDDIDSSGDCGKAVKLANNPVSATFVVLSKEIQQNSQQKPTSIKFDEKLDKSNVPPKFKIVIKVPSLRGLAEDTLPSLSKMICAEASEKVDGISIQHASCQNRNTLNDCRNDQSNNMACSFQTYRNIQPDISSHLLNNLSNDTNRFSIVGNQSTLNTFSNNCDPINCDSNNNFPPSASIAAIKHEFFEEDRSSASSTQSALTGISSPASLSPNGDFPVASGQSFNYSTLFATDYASLAHTGLADVHNHRPLGNFVSTYSNIISQDNIYTASDNRYQLGVDGVLRGENEIVIPKSSCTSQLNNSVDNNEPNTFCRPVYDRMKLERKRERNRAAATKCRRRKLERIAYLQNQVDEINRQNELLRSKLLMFADDVCRLRRIFENHRTNGCLMGVNFNEALNGIS